ncbi:MAG: FKBP-type peptidyl-prolyl cis-trans isomerase [Nitrososphaera sp.]
MSKRTLWALIFIYMISPSALAEEVVKLNTEQQKFSYAMGLQIAQSLIRQGIEVDARAFLLGIEDVLAGQEPRLSMKEMQLILDKQQERINKERLALAEKNQADGKAFLNANKMKEGIHESPNGVQYKIIEEGKGAHPKITDTVVVHYRGTLIDGREFDSSHKRGEPATLQINNVIKGWQEVLPMMREGAKWQVFIPAELAYGERGASIIGPNETLIFDIELVSIKSSTK